MKRHLIISAALSIVSTMTACTDTLSLDGMGEAALSMTRSSESFVPFASSGSNSSSRSLSSDTVQSFFVTVVAVEFQSQGAAGDSGWTRLDMGQAVRLDLMSLPEEGTTARVVAEGNIAVGSYRAVRLIISNPAIVFKGDISFGFGQNAQGGVTYHVELPGGDATIEAVAFATVDTDSEETVNVEFDAASSLSSVALSAGGSVLISLVIR